MRKPDKDDEHYPERIAESLKSFTEIVSNIVLEENRVLISSLYGLLLSSAYSLCESYYWLIKKPARFSDSSHYFESVRLKLHEHLPTIAKGSDREPFSAELVGLHINTAQHFMHFLLDRSLNILLQNAFERNKQEMAFVFYNFVGMRVSLLRWRLKDSADLGLRLAELDLAFTKWAQLYHAGTCNGFVERIVTNPEVSPPPDSLCSLERGVRFTLGNDACSPDGALAYIIDRTNEAKHLPDGTGRAQLALKLRSADSIRRLYEVEWAITFVAFERMVDYLSCFLRYNNNPLNGQK